MRFKIKWEISNAKKTKKWFKIKWEIEKGRGKIKIISKIISKYNKMNKILIITRIKKKSVTNERFWKHVVFDRFFAPYSCKTIGAVSNIKEIRNILGNFLLFLSKVKKI